MPDVPWILWLLIALALMFDFLNGFHDSSNIVSTMIVSRALSGRQALTMTALAEFAGPFLFGVAVATTIGHEILSSESLSMSVVIAALMAAISWNILTWWLGIPSSSSHALIGGLIGAGVVDSGWQAIRLAGLGKVVVALAISPVLGLFVGYLVMKAVLFLARGASPRVNVLFKRFQTATALALALSHGTNDAQKTMGIITLGLVASGSISEFSVPTWVIALCATAIALGTATGGWRLIRTLGGKFYKIRPVHGLSTQVASASVILTAAILGGPVSTTQVVSSAIMGVGSAERMSKVHWNTGANLVTAWLLTIPASALFSALVCVIVQSVLPH